VLQPAALQDLVDVLSKSGPMAARRRPTYRSNSPRKVEMFINLKTAKALGLTVPLTRLL
jgi:hypothetical protein